MGKAWQGRLGGACSGRAGQADGVAGQACLVSVGSVELGVVRHGKAGVVWTGVVRESRRGRHGLAWQGVSWPVGGVSACQGSAGTARLVLVRGGLDGWARQARQGLARTVWAGLGLAVVAGRNLAGPGPIQARLGMARQAWHVAARSEWLDLARCGRRGGAWHRLARLGRHGGVRRGRCGPARRFKVRDVRARHGRRGAGRRG